MRKLLLTLLLVGVSATVLAGGYRVALQGVRQASMGVTSSMHSRDASAIFYNPAALVFIDSKFSISAGVFGIAAKPKWQDATTLQSAKTKSTLNTPVYLGVSYKPIDDLAIGLGFSTPYGSSLEWPDDWGGRSSVTKIDLLAYYIQPTIAYKFNDWFSIGGSFIYGIGKVNMKNIKSLGEQNMELDIKQSDAKGVAFSIGVMVKPTDKLTLGASYRSKMNIRANDGKTTWKSLNETSTVVGENIFPFTANKFRAMLPMPAELTAGVSYQITSRLLLATELSFTAWSRYEELDITLYNSETGESVLNSSTKNFRDRTIFRFGGEYMLTNLLAARLGYYFDPTPVANDYWSAETPGTDQHAFTAGLGYKFGENLYLDVSGQYLNGKERKVRNIEQGFQGDFKSSTFTFGLGVTYNIH